MLAEPIISALENVWPAPFEGFHLYLKRDDLLHPEVQGNKWRKLGPLLARAHEVRHGVLSFGGPYSNHLHALAAAGRIFGFPTAAVVRGTRMSPDNPTLTFAAHNGMKLFPVPKADYDLLKKTDARSVADYLQNEWLSAYEWLPEGGDSPEAVRSCANIPAEIISQFNPAVPGHRYICVPAGTGCTAAGIIAGAAGWGSVLVFPAAPYGVDRDSTDARIRNAGFDKQAPYEIVYPSIPLKFAETTPEITDFIRKFKAEQGVGLDWIYNGKMMFRIMELVKSGYFPAGSHIVAVHTGGLQGINAGRGDS
jgi:1-aminocyclopropane-1-carboxylate deaminase